jgi:hypothetical protein
MVAAEVAVAVMTTSKRERLAAGVLIACAIARIG